MPLFTVSFLVIVVSTVLYHVSQKSIASAANPVLSLLVTYGFAIAGTLLLLPFFPLRLPLGQAWRQINWASATVGLSIVGVELGFLLAYRSGWRISVGSAAANAALAVLLIPTGLLLFGERLSWANVLGVVLCLAGLFLVVMR
ncbi:MAG: EamA family transporter [Thermoanaerobaculia bacterium]